MRILLVEDHDDTAGPFARLLRSAGHEVGRARDVAEAREACRRQPFDVLVCDIGLPDGDGWALMRELKAACPKLSGIAVTAHAFPIDEARSRAAGFAAHLTKPVLFADVLSAVARIEAAAESLQVTSLESRGMRSSSSSTERSNERTSRVGSMTDGGTFGAPLSR